MILTSFSFSFKTWVSPWIVLSRFRAFFFSELSSFSFSSSFPNKVCLHKEMILHKETSETKYKILNRAKCHLHVPCFVSGYPPVF